MKRKLTTPRLIGLLFLAGICQSIYTLKKELEGNSVEGSAWRGAMNNYAADYIARKEKIIMDVTVVLKGTRPSPREIL